MVYCWICIIKNPKSVRVKPTNTKIIVVSKNENSKSIKYILDTFAEQEVCLISPKSKDSIYERDGLVKINDDEILNFNHLKSDLKIDRFGWYYQQFLKIESILQLDGENFFIIDGDSFVRGLLAQEDVLYTTGRPTHKSYEHFYKKIFPDDRLSGISFVTNQMLFNKSKVKEMVGAIEAGSHTNWIKVISALIQENTSFKFSEYQTYAEYVLNRYDVPVKKIKVFRRLDLVKDKTEKALKKYDVIAFEKHHKIGIFRLMRARLFYFLGRNLG